jgi:hypothetical protein
MQFAAPIALAAKVATLVGTGFAVKSSIDQKKLGKKADRQQEALLDEQKKTLALNAKNQRMQEDEVNKQKAGNQKSVLGAMFQRTLSGSRTGVTRNFGGG